MNRYHAGFTLIETLVAVSIVTIAVTGPLVTASRAINAAEIARDQLTASYLAQEGVEYVRAMRDEEYLRSYQSGGSSVSSVAWSWFYSEDPNDHIGSVLYCRNTPCIFDATQPMGTDIDGGSESSPSRALHTCSGTCPVLHINASHIYTQQSSDPATPFTRTVEIDDVAGYEEEKVVSTVSWNFHGTTRTVTVVDRITSWQ